MFTKDTADCLHDTCNYNRILLKDKVGQLLYHIMTLKRKDTTASSHNGLFGIKVKQDFLINPCLKEKNEEDEVKKKDTAVDNSFKTKIPADIMI